MFWKLRFREETPTNNQHSQSNLSDIAQWSHLFFCLFNKAQHLLQVGTVDKWSHPCVFQQGVSNVNFLSQFQNFPAEGL